MSNEEENKIEETPQTCRYEARWTTKSHMNMRKRKETEGQYVYVCVCVWQRSDWDGGGSGLESIEMEMATTHKPRAWWSNVIMENVQILHDWSLE